VREVVPDVLPAHVFELLAAHEAVPHYELLNVVIHILLEDRSYPKDIKGKGKARAAEERSAEISGDTNTSVDYTRLDASRHLGRVYQDLSLVRINVPFFVNC
jgi:TRIAD3 protein (E3 ubiquitin-protein ligase RNF216)